MPSFNEDCILYAKRELCATVVKVASCPSIVADYPHVILT
jgi:hypothetical protein